MKIIEAMKEIKANLVKITDLQKKISTHCANLSIETPVYGNDTSNKIKEWSQSCNDLSLRNVNLLASIARTNLATKVTITIGDKSISHSIAEWIWRRRQYAAIDQKTWEAQGDRGLKEGNANFSVGGEPTKVTIVRFYDPQLRDTMVDKFRNEPHQIDAALEVVNATTDLILE